MQIINYPKPKLEQWLEGGGTNVMSGNHTPPVAWESELPQRAGGRCDVGRIAAFYVYVER
jgi:hypothetical protein